MITHGVKVSRVDELTYLFLSAIVNAFCTGIALYIGFRKGVEKTVDTILNRLQERYLKSNHAQELVSSASSFFRNMNELMGSSEVKTLICDVSTLLRQLSSPPPKRKVKKLQQ
jgi:hypothetical protein